MGQLGLGLHFVVVEEHKHRGARAPMEQRTIEPAAAGADPAPVGAGAEGRRDHQFGSGQGVRTQPGPPGSGMPNGPSVSSFRLENQAQSGTRRGVPSARMPILGTSSRYRFTRWSVRSSVPGS